MANVCIVLYLFLLRLLDLNVFFLFSCFVKCLWGLLWQQEGAIYKCFYYYYHYYYYHYY